MAFKPEVLFVLSAVSILPEPEELELMNVLIPQIMDWNYLTNFAIERQMGPIIYRKLHLLSNSPSIPVVVKNKFKHSWLMTLSRSMVLIDHFKTVLKAFEDEGITVIALKGIYLSEWLYKEIGLRQFSDIDLMVKVEDGEKAIAVLSGLGYTSSENKMMNIIDVKMDNLHFSPMIQNGVSIEVHTKIHRKSEFYMVPIQDLWENSVPVTIHGVSTHAFSLPYLLLHLCLHLDKHFVSRKIQFTCFYDITNLLNQYAEVLDWDQFASICKRCNAVNYTYKYIFLSKNYYNANVPDSVVKQFGTLLKKEDVVVFENFLIEGNPGKQMSQNMVKYIGLVNGFSNKARFMQRMFFPPISFMMERYRPKRKSQVFLYYPWRFVVGIKSGFAAIISSIKDMFK